MPLALTSWLWPCQTRKYLFSIFYLFEFYFFPSLASLQSCYQHQRLKRKPTKLESFRKTFHKQKDKKILKIQIFFEAFQVWRACSQATGIDGLAGA